MAEATHEPPFAISEVAGGVSDPNAHNPGTGADDAIAPPENSDELVARRDDVINSMEERIAQHREADNADQNYQVHPLEPSPQPVPLPGNQGVAQPAVQQQQPAQAQPLPPEPGVTVQPMHPQAAPATAPTGFEGHPLAQHLVMHEGQAYMSMKVDGQDRLVPADRALAHMQRHEAAEIRIDQATSFQRQLQDDSVRLQQGFAELERGRAELTQAPQPPAVGDPADYLEEAQSFVTTAFTGSETDAAKQLASLLVKSRGVAQAAAPAMDPNQIATQAASLAVGQITANDRKTDEQAGYQHFARDFPDIMADVNLYNMADGMTDRIAAEHPDWLPSQVMQESGNRTRAWIAQVSGQPAPLPPVDPNLPAPPVPQPQPQYVQPQPPQYVAQPVIDDRQQRKDGLVVIPQAVTGPQLGPPAPVADENAAQSPADIMAEYRTARGQPT